MTYYQLIITSSFLRRIRQFFVILMLLGIPGFALGQGLSSISVTPTDATVGASTTHTIQFTTTSAIPADGRIVIDYPAGFSVGSVVPSSTTMDGTFTVSVTSQTVTVIRQNDGTATTGGATEDIILTSPGNATVAGSYTVDVETQDSTPSTIDSGTSSSFDIDPGILHHFLLSGEPGSIEAGQTFSSGITVTARDSYNNVKTDYTGSVYFTSTDGSAQLTYHSGNTYTFTSGGGGDNGVHTFAGANFELRTTTSQTITVTDGSISQASGTITVTPTTLASFALSGIPGSRNAGQPFSTGVTVTAYDTYSNLKTDYPGTLTWTSTDPYPATLPTDDGSGWSNGQKTFTGSGFVLYSTTSQTITATDGTVNQTSASITVNPGVLAGFDLSGEPGSIEAGQPFSGGVQITAQDAYANTITNFSGSVYFTSTDVFAQLTYHAGNVYTFTTGGGADNGVHTFAGTDFQLRTIPSQTITVTNGSFSQPSSTITVTPTTLTSFVLGGVPGSRQAGQAFSTDITVTAYDTYGNLKTNYSGTVIWSSTDPYPATLPTDDGSGWSNGQKTFTGSGFVLYSTTSQTIMATDGTVNQSGGPITVTPAALGSFAFTGFPASRQAGQPFSSGVQVTAFDLYGNQKTDYTGTLTWSSSDPYPATLPTDSPSGWSNGQKTFTGSGFILYTTTSQTIMATDGTVNQASGAINISPANLGSFVLSGVPGTVQAGLTFSGSITVTARDLYNNVKTDYAGQAYFTSTDPQAQLTVDSGNPYTFTTGGGGDNGVHVFAGSNFELRTLPSQTLSVTDGVVIRTSGSITVTPAGVASFTLSGVPGTVTAGIAFPSPTNDIIVTAFDTFGNQKTDYSGTVVWSSSDGVPFPASLPTDNGSGWSNGQKTFSGTQFALYSTPSQTITATDGAVPSANQTSSSITVNPNALSSLTLVGVPATSQAGQGFTSGVTVTAYDAFSNVKTNYTGQVYFSSTDPGAQLTYDTSNRYTFTTGGGNDNGVHVFSGGAFELRTTPSGQITVQDDVAIVSQQSGVITVTPGPLSNFTMTGEPSTIQAGQSFTGGLTVTAYDPYGNVKTNFTGQVYFSSTDGQSLLTYHSGNPYTYGVGDAGVHIFPGSRFELRTTGSQTITVQSGSANQTSGLISVTQAALADFTLSVPSGNTQEAGSPFALQVSSAQDLYNNDWSGSITVSAASGGGSSPGGFDPTFSSITVFSGTGESNQTLVRAESAVALLGQGGSVSRMVTGITVVPNDISALRIRNAPAGGGSEVVTHVMNIGETLALYAAGYDAFGNYRTDESANWSSTGLTPTVSNSGVTNITFAPTATGSGTISAQESISGVSDNTGSIAVQPGIVDHFNVEVTGSIQRVGHPFPVLVTARDAGNNVATGFTGRVRFIDRTDTIRPDSSGNFSEGIWSGGVTIFEEISGDSITVTQLGTGTPATGKSGPFDVIPAPGIQITDFIPTQSDTVSRLFSVTTSQTVDWYLRMDVENLGSGAVTLDSVRLSILVGGIEREDYVILYPDTFRGSGTSTLAGLSADSLLVTIDINGFDPGLATIRGFLYMTGGSGGSLQDEALTTVDVQTPADLAIGQIDPSQDEVSTGQDSLWTASVVVSNTGGSEVVIDSAAVDEALTFSLGSGWQVQRPGALNGGGWSISGGETDTLIFQINVTGTGNTGLCTLHVALNGIESNTGRVDVQDTQGGNWGTVMLETPAILNILRVDNIALNAPYVNVEQDFPIRVLVQNTGQDAAYDVSVNLTSSGLSIFPLVPPPVISRLAGGDSTSIEVQVQAHSLPNPREEFTAWVEGTAENTGIYMLLSSPDDTTVATIQSAALLSVEDVVPEVSQVLGGQADPWTVKVALRNAGAAGVVIDDPASDDLSFWAGTIYQTDYVVIPPTALMGGGLVLSGGERDTLLYTISSTGYWGGSVEIRATIEGVDANTELALSDSHSAGVQVQSNPAFRILATRVETLSKTEAGNGTVNTDQLFGIVVLVENGLRETIRDVSIQLQNNGASQIGLPSLSIARIAPSQWDSVRFGVTAASLENLGGEMFISSILEATLENSQIPAPIGPALDSTAVVTIQTPAQLSLSMELEKPDGLFSTSQTFTVRASLENSSSSEVDASGRVQLHLPLSYSLDFGGPGDTVQIVPGIPVEWSVIAPSAPQPILPIVAEIYETPNELNTGSPATILQSSDTVFVQTLESELNIDVSISNPPGAVDDTLSTGQQFTVHAVVWGSNVEDVTAQITLPPGYSTLDNTTKSVLSTDVYWVVKAPNNPMSLSYIQVSATGKDALQPDNPVVAPSASNPVTTVARADLALNLSTSDNSVSLGQAFVVTAHVANYGAATAVGQSSVILQILPTGYWTLDSMTQPVVNSTAFWTIHAPTEPSREAVTIRARISSLPLDHNTNDSVYVSQRTDGIAVTTVGGWLSISEVPRPAGLRNQVLPGDNSIWLMGLELVNRGEQGANGIFIQSLSVIVEDSQGLELSPDDVIDGIRALRVSTTGDTAVIDWSFEYGQLLPGQLPDTNPLTIDFTLHDTIPATDTTTIVLLGNIAETSVAVDFGLNIPDGSYIDARDEYSPGLSISVLDATSKEFSDMRSHPVQVIGDEIVEEDADPYVINCPNPFGEPGRELTTIRYYLKENARVVFRIYTLTGALVWSQEYPDSDPRATKGLHYDVFWDGRNDQGQIVLNGVYILVMETGYGEVGRTKIAVVK